MDEFCGTSFWDSNKTWYTDNPDFTSCFESTVLVWVPSAFLWLFAAMDIYYDLNSMAKNVPKSPLNICKTLFTLCLIIIEGLRLGYAILRNNHSTVYNVEYFTPAIRISTYILYLFLLSYSRKMGIQSSGVQFLYWFLTVLSEIITFRTILLNYLDSSQNTDSLLYILHVCNFSFIVGQFLLNTWADCTPSEIKEMTLNERPCPEKGTSFLNRLLFGWFDPIVFKGFRKPLEFPDLWDLNAEDKSKYVVPLFDKYWDLGLKKSSEKSLKSGKSSMRNVEFIESKKPKLEKDYTSVMPVVFKALGGTFLYGSLLKFIPDGLIFLSPIILKLLIEFTEKGANQETWKGYFYACVLFISPFISTLITAQYSHRMYLTGLRIRTGLVSVIYKKSLKISNTAKRETTVGEIVNLMSVDVQRIMDLMPFVGLLWSGPLQIGVAIYFLWGILGPFSLAGLVVMLLLVPINAIIAAKLRKLQILQMKYKDQRVKLMNEVLNGVKVLKLYAWEVSFEEQVLGIRAKEIDILKKTAWLNAGANFCWACAPFLVALSTFASYVLYDENNILTAEKAFVSLSYFNVMSFPLAFLPMIIVFMVQAVVSVKRLNKFMNSEEIDTTNVSHNKSEVDPIVIENGHFSWEGDRSVLKGINLRIREGSLVAIVGVVGSGKSSILNAMLGEMNKLGGRVNTRGIMGYVAQQAWIMNASLRENVLFSLPYDPSKYDRVIDACALKPDLQILPAGDKTEIGEKGINLSGGQKQRVSLARSTYFNADVYLLDDPLSAVDSHVGKHIFEHVIGPKGLLRRKTRVLVTHGVAYLPQMDQIIVMKDGEISEIGTFQELLDKKAAFAEFLTQHLTSNGDDLEDDDTIPEEIKKMKKTLSETEHESSGEHSIRKRNISRKISDLSQSSAKTPSPTKTMGKEKLIEIEKSETESVKLTVYIDYFRKAGWGFVFCTIIFYSLFQACAVGSNMWLSEWSNEATNGMAGQNGTHNSSTRRDMYLGVYGFFGILQSISIMAGTVIVTLGTLKSSSALHHDMLGRILQAPMSFFDSTPIGRIVNRFAKDVDISDNTIPFNLRFWLNGFFQVLATVVVISYSTPIFLTVIIPIGAIYYFVQKFYVSTSRQLKRLESVTRSPIYSHFGETIQGAATIRAYGMEENFILESEKRVDHNQTSYFPSVVSNRWLQIRLETIGNLVVFFAALFVVIGKDTLTPGIVGLSVSYALQITMALIMFVRWTSDLETNIVAIERLVEYSNIAQEAPRKLDTSRPDKSWPAEGCIKFEKYQTRYREGLDLVLKGVTCEIKPGEKIGVVGRTGAGKSSLTLALFRIIEPSGGAIIIDGKDISKMGLHDVRGRLTIIPQDPVLFSGTLRMNLDPFELYTDEAIWNALDMSHLKSFASELPAGLLYEIAEGGENLSVGQRQLVCLARALLRKAKILVLDEATAAIDLDTDDLIQNTIRSEFKDSTVITIAHRLNTIMDSSRVMVLDNGEIKEYEKPDILLKKKDSIFYSMAKDAGLVNN